MQFLDLLFFAAIAAFLVFRLWSVLGRRDGLDDRRPPPASSWHLHEDKDDAPSVKTKGGEENVVRLSDRSEKDASMPPSRSADDLAPRPVEDAVAPPRPIADEPDPVFAAICKVDPDFDPEEFLAGARAAFEMAVDAFARGDKKTLQSLLSKEVYLRFAGAVDVRVKKGEVLETTIIRIVDATIEDVAVKDDTGQITVTFHSEQIKVIRDLSGDILDGDPNHVQPVTDRWAFQRDLRSPNPNWVLTATHG